MRQDNQTKRETMRFNHSFLVDSPIDEVWRFYTNIHHLQVITPKKLRLEIVRSDDDLIQEGSECWIQARLFTNSKWHSKISSLKPYEYTDEMQHGRFKTWKHLHKFNKITENRTEVIDVIDFELPFGLLGSMFEKFAMRKLRWIFEYREKSTIRALCGESQI